MNKKGFELVGVLISIIMSILIVAIIVGGCAKVSNVANKLQEPTIQNEDLHKSFASSLGTLNTNQGQNIIEERYPATEKELYSKAKYSEFDIVMKKHEFFFFFSKGTQDISLTTDSKGKFIFKRPVIYECEDRACICYVENLELWDLKIEGENKEITINEELKEGLHLGNEINCVSVPNANTVFVSNRGFINPTTDEQYMYEDPRFEEDKLKSRMPVPLEITSLAAYKDKQYLLSKFDNQRQSDLLKFLLEQKWNGGLIIGDYGPSTSNSIETKLSSNPRKLYFVDFQFNNKQPIVSINLDSVYSLKESQIVNVLPQATFDNILEQLVVFMPIPLIINNAVTILPSIVNQHYISLEESLREGYFNPEPFFDIFEKAKSYNTDINLTIKSNSIKLSIKDLESDEILTDIKFTLPKDTSSICVKSFYYIPINLQMKAQNVFVDCKSKIRYEMKYSDELNGLDITKIEVEAVE